MDFKCGEIIDIMEEIAPPFLAEDWDNIGLMLGSREQRVKRILICLDASEAVAEEAVCLGADMIISHHPLIFKGLKSIVSDNAKGRLIYKLIKNGIAVYSAHTNLDAASEGVNQCLAESLGLQNIQNLNSHRHEKLFKIAVFVPEENADSVRSAMSEAGGGWIGGYSHCSFTGRGIGTFKALEGTNPYIGSIGKLESVNECKIETVATERVLGRVVDSMLKVHPYEEPAYDIYPLEIKGRQYGMGRSGVLPGPESMEEFIGRVKAGLNIQTVRVIGNTDKKIERAAVFCGSFDGDLRSFKRSGADVLVTGDIKYHMAQDISDMGLCAIDAGHFATERIIVPRIVGLLKNKFPKVDILASNMENDPLRFS
ncbi:dinuclear metal center YbgI/SA1388 family protein [Anaerobacterium chartisolvens]|uniref:GTP cyclohydrolase 1 type 2 homolog n=1 Tax=Anaerobacterium chartisolvens TaxID=1297424 RepID=A0A369AWQ2_9FIRM|nr:Nif3-like dinuclear metal center hexameric protein [Anaerobacterium chartisolvens]RCX13812.1 dinuclear metal center YbgI/SA1388 family protein [Anaerobacterium chartisolvens]